MSFLNDEDRIRDTYMQKLVYLSDFLKSQMESDVNNRQNYLEIKKIVDEKARLQDFRSFA